MYWLLPGIKEARTRAEDWVDSYSHVGRRTVDHDASGKLGSWETRRIRGNEARRTIANLHAPRPHAAQILCTANLVVEDENDVKGNGAGTISGDADAKSKSTEGFMSETRSCASARLSAERRTQRGVESLKEWRGTEPKESANERKFWEPAINEQIPAAVVDGERVAWLAVSKMGMVVKGKSRSLESLLVIASQPGFKIQYQSQVGVLTCNEIDLETASLYPEGHQQRRITYSGPSACWAYRYGYTFSRKSTTEAPSYIVKMLRISTRQQVLHTVKRVAVSRLQGWW
ncbi:hypothetical protein BDZ89DRAFT_1044120 [Hymenopellis radicata]|nr:hypothetical protein BDZ89DRAFT_1044120 [Hymenopellis radicata]